MLHTSAAYMLLAAGGKEPACSFIDTSHPRRTTPTGTFFFLCDLCHCFTCVVASRERLEPSRAVKYRRLVGETTGSAVCEKCVYQSRLQAVNTVCETSTQRRRQLSAHLPFWSFDHRQWAHQTWLTGTPHMKNALKSLWSLYDLPFMCKIVLMCWLFISFCTLFFRVQRGTNSCTIISKAYFQYYNFDFFIFEKKTNKKKTLY